MDFARGLRIADIARRRPVSRDAVEGCLARAAGRGPLTALRDRPGRGRPRSLTPEARTWVVELACIKPKDLDYAAELWTHAALAKHVPSHREVAGHPSLSRLGSGIVAKILTANQLLAHRIDYDLEHRDPEFDTKRVAVTAIYPEVELLPAVGAGDTAGTRYGEKPGNRELQNLAADLPPAPGRHRAQGRDQQDKRHAAVSRLAGIDLVDGAVHGIVRERHRSREFVEFVTTLDQHCPPHTQGDRRRDHRQPGGDPPLQCGRVSL